MINKRFQRPINEYTGSEDLLYRDKYQQDSGSVPKIAISSSKMDGDFNYLLDAVNTLDEDVKSVVHTGISNQTINNEHILNNAISEIKMANEAISSRSVQPGAITNAKLADLSVTTPKISNNSITKDKMATASVGTDELLDGAITKDKLAPDAISDSVPVGAITQFSANLLPTGWILCNGATLSKNTYPQLVRFLTGSDVTLSVEIPNLNTDINALAKYAIKAFSDVAELATLEIAGLTQDIANNTAAIAKKADKFAETIAEGCIEANGVIESSRGLKTVTKRGTGIYILQLADELKGKNFKIFVSIKGWGGHSVNAFDYVNGTVEVRVMNYNVWADIKFEFIILETKEA